MIWTKVKRVLRSGFFNFWRNAFVSVSSVLVMTVTLLVIASVIFLSAVFKFSLAELKDKVDINVYFVTSAAEDDILAVKKSLEVLPEVKTVTYTSRESALEAFKKRHENDQFTLQALDELGDNPLGASLNIKAKETSQYEGIATFLEGKNIQGKDGAPIVDKINYFQNKIAIDRLTRIISGTEKAGLALTIILIIISILITLNTLRLAIYTSKEEIGVMRLVGASAAYIRGPFVVTGIIYGVISGIFTLIILAPVAFYLGGITQNFFIGLNLFQYYVANFGQIFLVIVGSGVLIGAVSSYVAVKRYLKV